jgi:hypothetical protein
MIQILEYENLIFYKISEDPNPLRILLLCFLPSTLNAKYHLLSATSIAHLKIPFAFSYIYFSRAS